MTAIDRLLKPVQHKKNQLTSEKINELFALSDHDLGKQLLDLSKEAWSDFVGQPGITSRQIELHKNTYLGAFVFELIPEIAALLGYRESNKEMEAQVVLSGDRHSCDSNYRFFAGQILKNTPTNTLPHNSSENPTAFEILTHDVANGNPIAFAVDRLVKPVESALAARQDWLSGYTRGVSLARGLSEQYCWTPAMQNYAKTTGLELDGFDPISHKPSNIDRLTVFGVDDEDEHEDRTAIFG